MQSLPAPRFALVAALALFRLPALVAGGAAAADPTRTEMAPFRVEAEFGVEGLRIQNSTSVLNPYLLEQHGVAQLQDVTGIAPNLFSSNSDTRGFGDVLVLRGAANSIFFSPPAVALYVDDVPGGSVSSYPSSLLNVETLVVKAGPQGTDYGRNAPGGVIEIKSRTPGSTHRGTVTADYGSYNASSLQAGFDGPVSREVGYSVGLGLSDRDGYIRNTTLRASADDRRSVSGRGALYWKPGDKLQLRFGAMLETISDDSPRLSSLFSPDPYSVGSNLRGETRIDRRQFSFQVRRTFDWGTLLATTSRQDWDLDPAETDLDLSPLPLAFSRVAQSERVWTQEIRFESLPGARRTQWRAGLFYFDSTTDGDALREFVVPPSAFVPPGFVQTERTVFTTGQRSVAGHASLDQPMTEKLLLKVGARLEQVEGDIDRTKASSNNFRFPTPPDPRLQASQRSVYASLNSGAVLTVTDSVSLVARTSLAHKPEGYSAFTGSPQLTHFDGERIWASEAGVTFGPPKGRFAGSLLAFWNVMRDYQFERTVPNSTDFVVVNARRVVARGIEGKFMWNPVDRVWWDFQTGCTDATFEDHRDSSGASVNGRQVPFVPKLTLRTGVTVDLGRGFSANASYASTGRTFFDERNTGTFAQKSYGIVNGQLRCRLDRWTMTVYGQNLFQRDYYQFINPEIFAGSPGAPRRFGVQLTLSY
jgi:iron complex outermembrane receptor protein